VEQAEGVEKEDQVWVITAETAALDTRQKLSKLVLPILHLLVAD